MVTFFFWIELAYSSIVETFSALDLYTDIIVFEQLYDTRNQGWASSMLILLIAPYLVSHGSLVVLLQNKLSFNNEDKSCCCSLLVSFAESLLMTPVAIVYLFCIDLIFMLFAVFSTIWLFLVIVVVKMTCRDIQKAAKYDSRDWIDKKIFEQWLRMNRTEIVGYRRLRTLSQLFFETMPQILLQLRIIWVIQWSGDEDNAFNIDLNTIFVSVGLAIAHLILEGGIIYLDKSAFQMGFMQYSLQCLGGRVQWIPFQHLIPNLIRNQLYIFRDGTRRHFDASKFDAVCYKCDVNPTDDTEEEQRKQQLMTLNYEDISADLQCISYSATYQFSPQSMDGLAQILVNSPSMDIPASFRLVANIPLQTLMRQILCRATVVFGATSLGNVNMISLCNLYRTSINKVNIQILDMSEKTIQRLMRNVDRASVNNKQLRDEMNSSLVNYGMMEAIQWMYKDGKASRHRIDAQILSHCLSSIDSLRLDILRRFYQQKHFVGSCCDSMKIIKPMVNECLDRAETDKSWYFVILLLLLYTKGNLFGGHCSGWSCTLLNEQTKRKLLKEYLPAFVVINELKIPFEVFDAFSSGEYRTVYSQYIEEILINKCKDFMISENTADNKIPVVIAAETVDFHVINAMDKLLNTGNEWKVLGGKKKNKQLVQSHMERLLYQLQSKHPVKWNVKYLDDLMFQSRMKFNYRQYLGDTQEFRVLQENQFVIESKQKVHEIPIDALIRDFAVEQRYQIFQVSITPRKEVRKEEKGDIEEKYKDENDDEVKSSCSVTAVHFVVETLVDELTKFESNKDSLYLFNPQTESKHSSLTISVATNVALSYYNHYVLHAASAEEIAAWRVRCNEECVLEVNVQYAALCKDVNEAMLLEEEERYNQTLCELCNEPLGTHKVEKQTFATGDWYTGSECVIDSMQIKSVESKQSIHMRVEYVAGELEQEDHDNIAWVISDEQAAKYRDMFGTTVTGRTVSNDSDEKKLLEMMRKYANGKMTDEEVSKVWKLAVAQFNDAADKDTAALALYLIDMVKSGKALPRDLGMEYVPPSKREVYLRHIQLGLYWVSFKSEMMDYSKYYNNGILTMNEKFSQQTYVTHPWKIYNRGLFLGFYVPTSGAAYHEMKFKKLSVASNRLSLSVRAAESRRKK